MDKIRSFTGLVAWKEEHKLVLMIYDITEKFPHHEEFGLKSQLRRAAVSITSNIAEGFRRRSRKEKRHFYDISLSSLTEVQNELLVAKDVSYLSVERFSEVADQTVIVGKLLNGLMKSAQSYVSV